jgi:hypothetical protein
MEDGFVIGLRIHSGTAHGDRFDRTRGGLDHIAWWAQSREQLEALLRRAKEMSAENSGIAAAPGGLFLSVKDPDGTALEYLFPTSASE